MAAAVRQHIPGMNITTGIAEEITLPTLPMTRSCKGMIMTVALIAITALTLALLSHFGYITAGSVGTICLFTTTGIATLGLIALLARYQANSNRANSNIYLPPTYSLDGVYCSPKIQEVINQDQTFQYVRNENRMFIVGDLATLNISTLIEDQNVFFLQNLPPNQTPNEARWDTTRLAQHRVIAVSSQQNEEIRFYEYNGQSLRPDHTTWTQITWQQALNAQNNRTNVSFELNRIDQA